MKTALRAFGIGLFFAGASYTILDKLDRTPASTDQIIAQYETQIEELEAQLTEARQMPTKTGTVATQPTEEIAEENPVAEPSASSSEIVEATIYIYETMSLYDIGQQVEDLGIVSNGRELELYLSKPDYSRSIQKGAFDLRSDMTIDVIAKTLTGKKLEE